VSHTLSDFTPAVFDSLNRPAARGQSPL